MFGYFGPYKCWINYSVNKVVSKTPRFQIFSQFRNSRFFGFKFPDSRFIGPLFPDSRLWFTPPPLISHTYVQLWQFGNTLRYTILLTIHTTDIIFAQSQFSCHCWHILIYGTCYFTLIQSVLKVSITNYIHYLRMQGLFILSHLLN